MSKNTGTSELINYFDLGANGDVGISGSLTLDTIANAVIDTDKFLVSDNGIIKYRTGAELLADIGAQGALTNPVTGTGTIGTIPIFTGSTTIGDSIIQANSTEVNIVGNGSELLFDSLGSTKNGGIGYTNDFVLNVYNSRGTGSAIELGNENLNLITDSTTRLTITDAGNVLIGSPPAADNGARLQVDGSVEVSINNAFRIDGGRFLLYNGGTFIGDIDNKGGAVYIREDGLNVITIEEQNTTFSGSVTARNTISISASTAGGTSSININGLGSGGTSVAGTRIDGIPEGSGPAASMGFVTRDSAGNRTEKMRITSNGEILIGGTVELNTAATVTDLTIQGTGRGQLNLFRNDTSIADTNTIGIIGFWGNDTTSNIPKMHASIEAAASGTHSAGSNPTDLIFTTTSSASETKAERMRITSSGSVGIGTDAPSNKLDIQSANGTTYAATPQLRVGGGGVNNSYAQILFSDNALSDGKISYFPAAAEANRFFSISARQTESDFVIRGNGNVLIGTTTDSGDKLFVNGNISFNGSINGSTFQATNTSLTVDANNEKKSGFYRWNSTSTNLPESGFFAVVIYGNGDNVVAQMATHFTNGNTYVRAFNSAWSAWKRLDT